MINCFNNIHIYMYIHTYIFEYTHGGENTKKLMKF